MESSSLFSDDFESVPVSCFLESSRQQLVVLQSRAVPFSWSMSGHSVSMPRVFCARAAVLGSGNVYLQVWHRVGKAPSSRFSPTGRDTRPDFRIAHGKFLAVQPQLQVTVCIYCEMSLGVPLGLGSSCWAGPCHCPVLE